MGVVPFRRTIIPYFNVHITYYIVGANILLMLAGLLVTELPETLAVSWLGLSIDHAWWQLFTWFFMEPFDQSLSFSVIINAVMLVFFGSQVESEMGSGQFLLVYLLIGALTGLAGSLLFNAAGLENWPLFGSSGMVLAVMVLFAALYPDRVVMFMGIVPIRAGVFLTVVLLLELLLLGLGYGWRFLVQAFAFLFAAAYVALRYRVGPWRLFKGR